MPRRKYSNEGKKNDIKIKNIDCKKRYRLKRGIKREKPLGNVTWTTNPHYKDINFCEDFMPHTLRKKRICPVKHKEYERENLAPVEEQLEDELSVEEQDQDQTLSTEGSECNCSESKFTEENFNDINKSKSSSSNSILSKYIKLGMNQVASFIVESAIRFGREHGVVVPDKNTPNLYKITPPDGKLKEKFKKMRFRNSKRSVKAESEAFDWGEPKGECVHPSSVACSGRPRGFRSSSWVSSRDSLDEVLPILDKLKQEGGVVKSELDLETFQEPFSEEESQETISDSNKEINRKKKGEAIYLNERDRQRLKEKCMKLKKTFKKERTSADKDSRNFKTENKCWWKKGRKDSLELLRQKSKSINPCKKE